MRTLSIISGIFTLAIIGGCMQDDTTPPLLMLQPDSEVHYRLQPYTDPGFDVADNMTCITMEDVIVTNNVDIQRYGTYQVSYSATDAAGNSNYIERNVDIVLPINDYYDQTWSAYDTCTSGIYNYIGLIQDCACAGQNVIVGNISNFGLSASFTLPVNGQYNHMITLDTTKAGVTFFGLGQMNPTADSLFWEYTILDSVETDACRSTWIK